MKKLLAILLGISLALSLVSVYKLINALKPAFRTVNIVGPINPEAANKFRDVMLQTRSYDETVVYIESYGGLTLSAYKMMYYMKTALGDITCVVDSHAASAGAMIASSCDKLVVMPNAILLFHLPRYCQDEKCARYTLIKKSDPLYQMDIDALESVRILTDEELTRIKRGEDVILTGMEFMERLDK